MCSLCFFFQAEDGIRDLVRSRGLGDVYKRQVQDRRIIDRADVDDLAVGIAEEFPVRVVGVEQKLPGAARAVSYTHLTLPTSDLV